MLFLEPEQSPFDLTFRFLGVDVRVSPWFWAMGAFIGWGFLQLGFQYLVLWIVCWFVSILVHEMGHVVAGRVFGSEGHIILYGFGGLAIGSNDLRSRWQRILVALAGPFAQFGLYGLAWLFREYLRSSEDLDRVPAPVLILIAQLLLANWFWPLLNLLPIWPLDGGRVSRDLLDWLAPARGVRISLGISLVLSGLIAINSLVAAMGRQPLIPYFYGGGMFSVFLFGMLAVMSYQLLQLETSPRRWDDGDEWGR